MSASKTTLTLVISVLVFFSIFFTSPGCKKTIIQQIHDTTITIVVDSNLDRQLMFPIGGGSSLTTTPGVVSKLYKFNKNNYQGVDSIILMADPYVLIFNQYGDSTDSSIVTLYDVTDSVMIAGSTLRSNSFKPEVFLQTGNLFKALPAKEITLGMTVQSAKDERSNSYTAAVMSQAYLFLFRK